MRYPQQLMALFAGLGRVPPPEPGNRANAPADPPVQFGSYEYIQHQMFPDMSITMIDNIPPEYQNWGNFAVNSYGLSGLEGGGISQQPSPVDPGGSLFYDPTTNMYVQIGG